MKQECEKESTQGTAAVLYMSEFSISAIIMLITFS